MKKPKIAWQTGKFGMIHGFVCGQRLFDIDAGATPLQIRFNIGASSKTLKAAPATIEEARLAAQTALNNFLNKIEYEN